MKEQVNPNVLAYEPSPGKMTELFQSGQAVLAVWGTGRVHSFANTGFPVDFVYPKEGAATLLDGLPGREGQCLAARIEFVKMLLEPKIQLVILKDYGYGPVKIRSWCRRNWQDGADRRACCQALQSRLGVINAKREEWTKRWNREVER